MVDGPRVQEIVATAERVYVAGQFSTTMDEPGLEGMSAQNLVAFDQSSGAPAWTAAVRYASGDRAKIWDVESIGRWRRRLRLRRLRPCGRSDSIERRRFRCLDGDREAMGAARRAGVSIPRAGRGGARGGRWAEPAGTVARRQHVVADSHRRRRAHDGARRRSRVRRWTLLEGGPGSLVTWPRRSIHRPVP